jgi:predicted PurR-regulated permease PerM
MGLCRRSPSSPDLVIRPSSRLVFLGIAALLALLLFVFEGEVLLGLFAGVLLGVLFWEVASFVARHTGMPYGAAAAMVLVVNFVTWGIALWLMGAPMAAQLHELATQLPKQVQAGMAYLHHSSFLRSLTGGASLPNQTPSPEKVVTGTALVVSGAVEALGGVVVVGFIGSYIAFDPKIYVKPLAALAPPEKRRRVEQVVSRVAHTLGRWLLGRIVAMAFVGVFTGVGLLVLKIPLALALGVVAGLLAFVEYVGAIASAIPAIALALTVSATQALWVALLYLGVHIIEGYVLTPLLAKKAVHLPPAYVLAGQMTMGVLYGAMGLTFSTPLIVVIVVVVQMLYVERMAPESSPAH